MEKDQTHFDQLAKRYLEGRLTDPEYEELSGLLGHPDNYRHYFSFKESWTADPDKTSQSAWKRLSRSIRKETRSGVRWFSRVAAVLIPLLLISVVYFYQSARNGVIRGATVVETPRGEKSHILLPDGTEIWLNASSKISYEVFTTTDRQVKLVGEAYFKVARKETSPFTVKTSRSSVAVLGTEFNVMTYNELNRDEITLVKGVVRVTAGGQSATLGMGEKVLVSGNEMSRHTVNADQVGGWVDNKFNFNRVPLSELVLRLENWYDVDIDCPGTDQENTLFTGTFKNEETIWEVLEAISVYLPLNYEKTDTRKIRLTIK